jgi:ATP-dependent Clp protease ATP-binding subunit ClpA
MLIWTPKALDVLRDAATKAESMRHHEVHPLHLLWVATTRSGLEALRTGRSDQRQAKLRFQVERDLNKLPLMDPGNCGPGNDWVGVGPKLQRLLLRAADFSARNQLDPERGRIGVTELLKALLPDDHRAASLLRARQEHLFASA